MPRFRLASAMALAGTLLMLASIGLLSSVATDWEQLNGSHRLHKMTVNIDRAAAAPGAAELTLQEAERLKKAWSPLPILYSAREQSFAKYERSFASCYVVGVSGSYREFAQARLTNGTSISDTSIAEHSKVAVISAQVASRLFGSQQVIGKTMELYNTPFIIIGVLADSDSLLLQMSNDGMPEVLIPISTYMDVASSPLITNIELAAKPDAAVRGEAEVKQALMALGKNPIHYRIENGELVHAWTTQKRAMLLFVYGISAIILMARIMAKQLSVVRSSLQSKLHMQDWYEALHGGRITLLKHGLLAAAMIACGAGLWMLIGFRLYLPADWIPEEIIDLSFYVDKLRSQWQQQVSQAGYVPSPHEMLTQAAAKLTGRLFFAGLLFGLPLFWLGVRLWAMAGAPITAQLQRLLLYIPAAVIASFVAARWAGLEYVLDLRDVAVTGALFFIAIIYIHIQKGESIYAEKSL